MQVEWLYRLARALHYQGPSTQDILRTSLSLTCTALEVKQACIITFDDLGELKDAFLLGTNVEDEQELWHKLLTQGLVGFVQHGQRTVNVRNISSDPRWPRLPGNWTGSAVGVPIIHHSTLRGALVLLNPKVDFFSDDVVEFLEEAAGLIAAAYENARNMEQIKAETESRQQYYVDLQREISENTRLEMLRRDLSSMTYHDLRGLLQNIYASLVGIEPYVRENRTGITLQRLATQSTRQMTRMVKGLLDIDRLEQGSAVINKRRTGLPGMVDELMELVHPTAAEADQELTCELVEPLPNVQIDPDMITRVVVNLIENAIKHTPEKGRVMLKVSVENEMVYFRVNDTGPGIPVNHQKEIFDKYYRIKHADAPNGVGLGLAFCRLAVEAHGGKIWVDNLPEGGASFIFTLPLEPTAAAPATATTAAARA